MKKINKVILGVAAGGLAMLSQGYSNKTPAADVRNYQDTSNRTVQTNVRLNAKPTPTPESKPTSKPTPTYAPKPTPTYAPKPTAKPSAKPQPKATPTPNAKPSPKVSATPQPKPSPKTTPSNTVRAGNVISGIGKFFGGLFGR